MIEAISKGLNQKLPMIKLGPPARHSRVLGLWFVLLVLYFMLLPSAADIPERGLELSASGSHTMDVVSSHRPTISALRR